jgi:hypothetical protein
MRRPRKPSPATLISLVALFVALGGTSYAALKLPKNSVGARELKANSVGASEVKAGSLVTSDFKRSERSGLAGPQGPQGPPGPQGLQGPQGPAGAREFARVKGNNGQLVNGTALASYRSATGTYYLTFANEIDKCAASATSTAYEGFDGSVYRVWAQVGVGVQEGGAYNKHTVAVNLFDSGGSNVDSSFSLILVCP